MSNQKKIYMGIEFRKVSKIYHKGINKVEALKDISLNINNKEFLAVTGKSGSGKSTLISLIGGLDLATTGKIIIDGTNLSTLNPDTLAEYRRRKIGFIFQSFNLIPTLTVFENVMLPLVPIKMHAKEKKERVMRTIREVNIEERINHLPKELSGGEQQRVAIARALVNNPSIILADEPTGNLDSATGKRIIELLKNLNRERKTTIIMVSHDDEIAKNSDRIIKLKDGKTL